MRRTIVVLSAIMSQGVFADCSVKNDTKYNVSASCSGSESLVVSEQNGVVVVKKR